MKQGKLLSSPRMEKSSTARCRRKLENIYHHVIIPSDKKSQCPFLRSLPEEVAALIVKMNTPVPIVLQQRSRVLARLRASAQPLRPNIRAHNHGG